jgi:hypothetical protein
MPMLAATLKSGLEALTVTDDPGLVVSRLTTAFNGYFSTMMATPFTAITVAPGIAAFTAAISSIGTADGNAATKLAGGITAFWGALVAPATFVGPGVPTAIIPPTNIGLVAALQAAFAANVSGESSLSAAAQAIADAIHANQSGGILNYNLPPPAGTPSTAPIT